MSNSPQLEIRQHSAALRGERRHVVALGGDQQCGHRDVGGDLAHVVAHRCPKCLEHGITVAEC